MSRTPDRRAFSRASSPIFGLWEMSPDTSPSEIETSPRTGPPTSPPTSPCSPPPRDFSPALRLRELERTPRVARQEAEESNRQNLSGRARWAPSRSPPQRQRRPARVPGFDKISVLGEAQPQSAAGRRSIARRTAARGTTPYLAATGLQSRHREDARHAFSIFEDGTATAPATSYDLPIITRSARSSNRPLRRRAPWEQFATLRDILPEHLEARDNATRGMTHMGNEP